MRIFFSVGEPSGDLHGSNLIKQLKNRQPDITCVGFGGPKMAAAGCEILFDLTSMGVMFLWDAIRNLRFFFGWVAKADKLFEQQQIDAVVLIDYPGFNWWIAKKAKKRGIPVFYYGVPQVWAWAPWRIKKIRKYVDHVLCKLPFEVPWFRQRDCMATFVGHPYFDQLVNQSFDEAFASTLPEQDKLVVLPGSRDREVENVLPTLIKAAEIVSAENECSVLIAAYNDKQASVARRMLQSSRLDARIYSGRTPELMRAAKVCLACSGSVSLELLYHRKPTVILFKVKKWAMVVQSFLLRTRFITLVNLIAANDIRKTTWRPFDPDHPQSEDAVMPEYLTTGDVSGSVARWANQWLANPDQYQSKVVQMEQLANEFCRPGATERAAKYILDCLINSADVSTVSAARKLSAKQLENPMSENDAA
ncbi:MAG: lipid-A-disaccharide synthase [Planctomycetota bacterium]